MTWPLLAASSPSTSRSWSRSSKTRGWGRGKKLGTSPRKELLPKRKCRPKDEPHLPGNRRRVPVNQLQRLKNPLRGLPLAPDWRRALLRKNPKSPHRLDQWILHQKKRKRPRPRARRPPLARQLQVPRSLTPSKPSSAISTRIHQVRNAPRPSRI